MMEMFNEKQARINALKSLLRDTDYKSLKAAEGHPSSDWETVSANREKWRKEVDELEKIVEAEYLAAYNQQISENQ